MGVTATAEKAKQTRLALTGNDAGAYALMHVDPDFAAVFPITPQTELMHKFAEFVANGKVSTETIMVESEHSAMSAVVGAQAAGARSFTATSAAGFVLMYEIVFVASGLRLPCVMVVVNRAINSPINIHCDHTDSMCARDSGWVQLFSENSQEVYDNTAMSFRIAEDKRVLMPTMVTLDGFILSHTQEVLDVLDKETIQKFVGEYRPEHYLLNAKEPMTVGPLDLTDWLFEHKRKQIEDTKNIHQVVNEVAAEYAEISGRSYGLIEAYRCDDAEIVTVVLGSTAGTTKEAADRMREKGVKAGVLKIRCFRPFPGQEIWDAMPAAKAIGVMDRSIAFGLGYGGPVFHEMRSFGYELKKSVPMVDFLYGIGGRDIAPEHIEDVYGQLAKVASDGEPGEIYRYVNLRD